VKHRHQWGLAGGFVRKEESLEIAANRVLLERTGLDDIFLHQFEVFSDPLRSNPKKTIADFKRIGFRVNRKSWIAQRFITIGFYALVEYSRVHPQPDEFSDACEWFELNRVQRLMMDHHYILNKALYYLRQQLNYQPIGYNLLPDKFTMPELQRLYETILSKKLDRRNFQRKMLAYGILRKLNEQRKGAGHKAPYLYQFNLDTYHQALNEGLKGGW
jgi:ADP-ribose pyrophosphatase YjhB (NUDIX family)